MGTVITVGKRVQCLDLGGQVLVSGGQRLNFY